MPPPPNFASEDEAAEIAEVYWQAVTRDISFDNFATDTTIQAAVQDLNRFTAFQWRYGKFYISRRNSGRRNRTLYFAISLQRHSVWLEFNSATFRTPLRTGIYDFLPGMAECSKRFDSHRNFKFRSDNTLYPQRT